MHCKVHGFSGANEIRKQRHCEPGRAKQSEKNRVRIPDCFVSMLLAMTIEIYTNYSGCNELRGFNL